MSQLLQYFILIPLAGLTISFLLPRKKEKIISMVAIATVAVNLIGISSFIVGWLLNHYPILDIKHLVVFQTTNLEIFIDFYFDKTTAVFAFIGAVLTLLVLIFSRYYLHREAGFKRFFNNMMVFYTGYNIIIFSGNFETLFVGWELLGISSFLLIGFYRDRFLPVKNGLKVISVYRLSDICLLVAMWLSHHLWHENITFLKLADFDLVQEQLTKYSGTATIISVMILIAAAIKSAQLPFSSWLPRAMEGPTSSSAIFYGSLSVHIGVFILLRTYSFWQHLPGITIAVIIVGLATSIIGTSIASVQSSVKTQIAYSSIVQIGIIFIEVALGFHILALIHFSANAFLRTYQLLVSPSVLSYLVHDQFYNFDPAKKPAVSTRFTRLRNSLYILSVKEWDLDHYLYRYAWTPFKSIGKSMGFISGRTLIATISVLLLSGIYCYWFIETIPSALFQWLPLIYAIIGLLLVLKSFAWRGDARRPWLLVFSGQLFVLLSVLLNEPVPVNEIVIYLGGGLVSLMVGFACLNKISAIDNDIHLNKYHGYSYEQPVISFLFLLSCLGLIGFPITPTFIGVDLMFSHIPENQVAVMVSTCLSYIFIEIAVLRIYTRIFLGQHKKPYHAIAFRSS
ncbi:MAG TPA: proton-conducting transporter membrane subunit [Flavitalea sp.]|nr:proton-conducting transporter membrane subunit [Flavitalea sp.]